MRFTKIKLINWKNFQEAEIDLCQRAFIIGVNGSGKSNFLDAFRFLHDIARNGGGFQQAIEERGGMKVIRSLSARHETDVTIDVTMTIEDTQWRYQLTFNNNNKDKNKTPFVKAEEVWRDEDKLLDRHQADNANPKRLQQTQQTVLEQTIAHEGFNAIYDFFRTISYSHIVPQLVRDGGRRYQAQVKNDPYGSDFLEKLARANKKTRDSRLKTIEEVLNFCVPHFEKLTLERDVAGKPHLIAKFPHWRAHGARQDERHFSDGMLRLTGLLWAMMDGAGPLLLEEPELSLHPEITEQLPLLFIKTNRTRRQKPRQIIISTHAPEMLNDDGIAPEECLLIKINEEGSLIESAEQDIILKELSGGEAFSDVLKLETSPLRLRPNKQVPLFLL